MKNVSIQDISFKYNEYADIIIALNDKIEAINLSIQTAQNLNVQTSVQYWNGRKAEIVNTKTRFEQIIRAIDKATYSV